MVDNIIVEYVWIDGVGNLRSKIRVMYYDKNIKLDDVPEWNYDGSSTYQANGEDSEIIIKPKALFVNPLLKTDTNKAYIVMCDTYKPDGEPLINNHRHWANNIFEKDLKQKPWFGIEQEYFLIDKHQNLPLGMDKGMENMKKKQGKYYCSVGTNNAFGRMIAEEHLLVCLEAGISISGINAEVAPGQWEFQIGPCMGISQGDHLWIARYFLHKITEKYNVLVCLHPKPIKGDWNGSGCHTNYSTENMRNGTDGKLGIEYINEAIGKLELKHNEHMKVYGEYNNLGMTGEHETASFNKFSSGIANRGASIRIGNANYKNQKGYFEDRRPSSNCDPYLVIGKIFETTCL